MVAGCTGDSASPDFLDHSELFLLPEILGMNMTFVLLEMLINKNLHIFKVM